MAHDPALRARVFEKLKELGEVTGSNIRELRQKLDLDTEPPHLRPSNRAYKKAIGSLIANGDIAYKRLLPEGLAAGRPRIILRAWPGYDDDEGED
jgi:hypothetical protein